MDDSLKIALAVVLSVFFLLLTLRLVKSIKRTLKVSRLFKDVNEMCYLYNMVHIEEYIKNNDNSFEWCYEKLPSFQSVSDQNIELKDLLSEEVYKKLTGWDEKRYWNTIRRLESKEDYETAAKMRDLFAKHKSGINE